MGGRSAEPSGNRCGMHRPPGQLCSAVRSGHRGSGTASSYERACESWAQGVGVAGMGLQVCGPSVT